MEIPAPRTVEDVISDGFFLSAACDAAFYQRYAPIHGVEVNFDNSTAGNFGGYAPDLVGDVRIFTGDSTADFRCTRLAVIQHGRWHWATSRTRIVDVPDFHSVRLARQELMQALRTLCNGNPVMVAKQHLPVGAVDAVVAIHLEDRVPALPFQQALVHGLTETDPQRPIDEKRALLGLAAHYGISLYTGDKKDFEAATSPLRFSQGLEVDLDYSSPQPRITRISGGLETAAVLADAHYLAVEHQFLFTAHMPQASAAIDLRTGRLTVTSPARSKQALETEAHIIATVDSTRWRWAWADDNLTGSPAQIQSSQLRKFGVDHAVMDFVRPVLPVDYARELRLPQAAMVVLGLWNVIAVPLNAETTALVLFDAPGLALPPLNDTIARSVLAVPLAPAVASSPRLRQRALQSYGKHRGRDFPSLPQ